MRAISNNRRLYKWAKRILLLQFTTQIVSNECDKSDITRPSNGQHTTAKSRVAALGVIIPTFFQGYSYKCDRDIIRYRYTRRTAHVVYGFTLSTNVTDFDPIGSKQTIWRKQKIF